MSESEPTPSHDPAGPSAAPGPPDPAAESGLDSLQAGLAPEIARRVSTIFDAVEREAEDLRAQAREEARRYLEDAQRRADDMVRRRQQRIGELSDDLLAKAEAVVSRLDSAAPVREGFESLVRALGGAAERLSGEISEPAPAQQVPVPGVPGEGAGTAGVGGGVLPGGGAAGGDAPAAPAAGTQTPYASPPAAQGPPGFAGAAAAPAAGTGPGGWVDPEAARLAAIEMAAAGATRAEVRARVEERTGPDAATAIVEQIFGAAGEHERVPWTAFGG